MPDDVLKAVLLDLLYELRESEIPLLVGGGYGLFLKQEHLARSGRPRTVFPMDQWPQPRATNDIDILLRPEIVSASEHMGTIREALRRLRFEPIEGAEYYQFSKSLGEGRLVKIDFLAGPLGEFQDRSKVKVDERRIRPRPSVKLHAHSIEEAVAYEREPVTVPLSGKRSNGELFEAQVLLPQGFTYTMMKLFAFRDRKDDPAKEMAQHHALDLYRVVAMLTEAEYQVVQRLAAECRQEEAVREARRIVAEFFSEPTANGALRMREHPLFSRAMNVGEFIKLLAEVFPRLT